MPRDKLILLLREASINAGCLFSTLSDLLTLADPGTTLNQHLENWKRTVAAIALEVNEDRLRLLRQGGPTP